MDWKKRLKSLMLIQGFFYGGFGIYCLLFQNELTDFLGLGRASEPFWMFITVSLLFTLSIICFQYYQKPESYQYVEIVIFAKFIDATMMLIYFFISAKLGYFIGFLVDFTLGLLSFLYYQQTKKSD